MDRQKQHDRIRAETTQAWQIANFVRAKKLPDLESYLARRDKSSKPKSQTPQEMRDVLQKIGMRPRPMSQDTKKSLKFIRVQ